MPRLFSLHRLALALALFTHLLAVFGVYDRLFPPVLPESASDFAVVVVADDDTPLRSFPDAGGVWRYPVTLDQVSPLYLESLIAYEDRYFRWHPGINPLALCRAVFQMAVTGRPVSGGSTLTMQVARILHPHPRTIIGKLGQMFRALQLELRFSKDEILTLYLNYAPFGGPIEGVQAASFAYLGKSVAKLSHAEAALLAVLPQAPSRLRPDRYSDRAVMARDKVLDRMARFGIWSPEIVVSARRERVLARYEPQSLAAPLLARRLRSRAVPGKPVRTFIDPLIQGMVRDILQAAVAATPERTSAAALVVENATLKVRAYVGSADFLDDQRFGHVDMVTATRSPGSTLKPFLYGMAIEEGLIHSESLMADAPLGFGGYRPENFSQHFTGPVSAAEALQRSLNLPAVDLLDRIGPRFFDARLRQGGLNPRYPEGQGPNLPLILGGVGLSLQELVMGYTALARGGLCGPLRYTKEQPLVWRRLLDEGAAAIIRRILLEKPRTDLPGGRVALERGRQVAWKTGTSYGLRDAWTIGVTDSHTIGVWIGRPDGTPSPGQYGAATAAPVLFQIADALPARRSTPAVMPPTVSRAEICWPLGRTPEGSDDPLCHVRRNAWVLRGMIPPTFPDRGDGTWRGNPVQVLVDGATGFRVEAGCAGLDTRTMTIARWPGALQPWLPARLAKMSELPALSPSCGGSGNPNDIHIIGLSDGAVLRPPGARQRLPQVTLQAQGGEGVLYWLVDGDLVATTSPDGTAVYEFTRPGTHRITVMDAAGGHDAVDLRVIAPVAP